MKYLLLFLFSFSVTAQDVLTITADRKLDKEARTWVLSVESDGPELTNMCLLTLKRGDAEDFECFGAPVSDDVIRVVEMRGMEVLTIYVNTPSSFQVEYLHNYIGKKYRGFGLALLQDHLGTWRFYVPQIQAPVGSVHFVANTRFGIPVGVKTVVLEHDYLHLGEL